MSEIHIFNHTAMATQFQVRIAAGEKTYAAQTAQAAFALTDKLESQLSRFRSNSDIISLAQLQRGEKARVAAPVFACLALAKKMELATRGAAASRRATVPLALPPQRSVNDTRWVAP